MNLNFHNNLEMYYYNSSKGEVGELVVGTVEMTGNLSEHIAAVLRTLLDCSLLILLLLHTAVEMPSLDIDLLLLLPVVQSN